MHNKSYVHTLQQNQQLICKQTIDQSQLSESEKLTKNRHDF